MPPSWMRSGKVRPDHENRRRSRQPQSLDDLPSLGGVRLYRDNGLPLDTEVRIELAGVRRFSRRVPDQAGAASRLAQGGESPVRMLLLFGRIKRKDYARGISLHGGPCHTRRRAMRVRMQAKNNAPNTMVANSIETIPAPGLASVKRAPSKAINAKTSVHPNMYFGLVSGAG